jgi:NO-binding membrane sensor protein with MHYT domain
MDAGGSFPVYHVHVHRDTIATHVSYDAGYIILSFFTSLIGCVTTLEVLNRRTSTRGAYNWYVLLFRIWLP